MTERQFITIVAAILAVVGIQTKNTAIQKAIELANRVEGYLDG